MYKKHWTDNVPGEVRSRLSECRSLKADIPILVNAKWTAMVEAKKDEQGFTKEDALVSVLELLDCNGQFFDLTKEEYKNLISISDYLQAHSD